MKDGRSARRGRGDARRSSACRRSPTRPRRSPPSRRSRLADLPRENKLIPIEVTSLARHARALPRPLHQRRRLSRRRLRPARAAGRTPALRAAVRPCAARDRRRQRRLRAAVAAHRPLHRRHPAAALELDGRRAARPPRRGSTCAARRCPSRPASCWRSCGDILAQRTARQPRALPAAGAGGEGGAGIPPGAGRVELCRPPPARRLPRVRLGRRADGRGELPVLPAQARRRGRDRLGRRAGGARTHPRDPRQPRHHAVQRHRRGRRLGAASAAARGFPRRPAAHRGEDRAVAPSPIRRAPRAW